MESIPVDGQDTADIFWYVEDMPILTDVQDAYGVGISARSLFNQECHDTEVNCAGQLATPAGIGASVGSSSRAEDQLAIPVEIGASTSSSTGLGEWLRQLSLQMREYVDPPLVKELANLAQKQDNRLLITNTEGILDGLVRQLSHYSNEAVQSHAARALANLAINPHVKISIGKMPIALSLLVQLLRRDISSNVKKNAAKAVFSLTTSSSENRLIIAQVPDALRYLTELLTNDQQPDIQQEAASTFRNLASEDHNQKRIVECPGVVEGLAHILCIDVDPVTHCSAGKALLALTEKAKNCLILDHCPGARESLVAALHYRTRENGQLLAAKVLRNLARRHENKSSITHCPGALAGLEKLLQDSEEAQHLGVEILRNIIARDTSIVIWGSPVQHYVVDLLFKDTRPNLQTEAAKEVEDLTRISELGFISATFPRALEGLEHLLHNQSNLAGQLQVAQAITAMAATEDTNVAAHLVPRFLPGLVALLNNDGESVLKIALRALTRLANSSNHQSVLSQLTSARERLGQLKSNLFSPYVQSLAERVLQILGRLTELQMSYNEGQCCSDVFPSAQPVRMEEPRWNEGQKRALEISHKEGQYGNYAHSSAKRICLEEPGGREGHEIALEIFYKAGQYHNDPYSSAQSSCLEEPGWREALYGNDPSSSTTCVGRDGNDSHS